jgi:anti-anti-sigma factor
MKDSVSSRRVPRRHGISSRFHLFAIFLAYHGTMLRMEVEHADGRVFVRCDGALLRGSSLERLPELARTAAEKSIVLDLRRVRRIDAHGIGVLAGIAGMMRERGSELKLVHVSPWFRSLLRTCGLAELVADRSDVQSPAA